MSHALRTASRLEVIIPAEAKVAHNAPDIVDTFLWQADPRTLRFVFVSGQVGRILGADAARWLADRQPWRTIAGADRNRVEMALRRAVREDGDGEIEFTAVDADGMSFPARLIIRVARPLGAPVRLWGLMTDSSPEHRESTLPVAPTSHPLVAPPIVRRGARFAAVGLAAVLASYALVVSALRPVSADAPLVVAIQTVDQLEQILDQHAADALKLENVVGSMEASVSELVALGPEISGQITTLEALRAKISDLIAWSPPALAGRLRALLVKIDRATPKNVAPPAPESKPAPPPAGADLTRPNSEPAPGAPTSAPAAPPAAPSEAPRAPGMIDI
jgi:hypothetical protein